MGKRVGECYEIQDLMIDGWIHMEYGSIDDLVGLECEVLYIAPTYLPLPTPLDSKANPVNHHPLPSQVL